MLVKVNAMPGCVHHATLKKSNPAIVGNMNEKQNVVVDLRFRVGISLGIIAAKQYVASK
jgi:hypothetical protein